MEAIAGLTTLFTIAGTIAGICLFFAVFVWLHNISLNVYKIYGILEEWNYDRNKQLGTLTPDQSKLIEKIKKDKD
ncbi:MAG: hypothetical protein COS15_04045 [Caldiserica bacterium CG02_land_8_20_14_3_00_36_38]|nr:MAG: hypothetical protein COS15_04045 [Caldiserica bacterium CG02_land_8_20_14_3_00_36_38]